MYPILLATHNVLRWVIVFLAVLALARSYRGWLGKREWSPRDRQAAMFYTIALDVQLLLGLLLYFAFSSITKAALSDFGAAMGSPELRFFALEHTLYMTAAVVLAHIGSAAGRKDLPAGRKFQRMAIYFSLSVVAILLGMPWMRPLLPGLG